MGVVNDIDRGFNDFLRNMKQINGAYVKVGFPVGFKPGPQTSPDGSPPNKASEILIIGATHEFGTDRAGPNQDITIPERSYLRSSFDEDKELNSRIIEKAYGMVLARRASVKKALGLVGLHAEARAKKKMRDLRTPPLALSTLKRRRLGSSNPLIDTNQLVNSLRHEVNIS